MTSVLSISLMRPDIGRYSTPSQGMLPKSASESKPSREITLVKPTWSFSAIRAGMVSPSWDGRGDRGDGDRARDAFLQSSSQVSCRALAPQRSSAARRKRDSESTGPELSSRRMRKRATVPRHPAGKPKPQW
jgi:hypothetical protein